MSCVFEEAASAAQTCLKNWPETIGFLQVAEGPGGERFNQEEAIPGTDCQLWWFDERVTSVCGLVAGLATIESDTGVPIPLDFLASLEGSAQRVQSSIDEITRIAAQVEENGINSLNPENWIVVVDTTNEEANLASHLQTLKKHIEALLKHYLTIAPIVHSSGFDGFVEAVREFSETAEAIRKHAAEAESLTSLAATSQKEADNFNRLTEEALLKASEILSKIEDVHTQTDEINQTGQEQLDTIEVIKETANSLKSEVEQYRGQFEEFQNQLSDRTSRFDKWSSNADTLIKKLAEKDTEIDDTIKRAEKMLVGATNAGLAATYKTSLDDLNTKLTVAQNEFYRALVFVFVSALPLTIYVISSTIAAIRPELVGNVGTAGDAGFWSKLIGAISTDGLTLSATLALFLIMVPSIWLAKFSASKYNQLFQLREHYLYKYSVAMAVDGFKKQAPEHADAIAAESFNRLLFNPADRISGADGIESHPSPLMNYLMNKFGFNANGKNS